MKYCSVVKVNERMLHWTDNETEKREIKLAITCSTRLPFADGYSLQWFQGTQLVMHLWPESLYDQAATKLN